MKTVNLRLLAMTAVTFLMTAPPSDAAPIRGASPNALAAWVEAIEGKLEKVAVDTRGSTGSTIATFRRAENGRMTDVQIFSENLELKRATQIALRELGRLPALPRGLNTDQVIRVQLLFAEGLDDATVKARRNAMLAFAAENNRQLVDRTMPADIQLADAR